jgi:DNA-binding IclR family transcriptional regulator
VSKTFPKLFELPIKNSENTDRQFVTALARGLEVLRAFEPNDGPLGNQELAERTGIPKPTVSRLIHTLTALGYLEYIPRLSKYRIGMGVLALGHACISGAALRTASRPHMQKLATYSDATVALGGRDRLAMMYLDVCRGAHTATFPLEVGAKIPIYRTAMGYAYLWGLPKAQRELLLAAIAKRTAKEWPSIKKQLDAAFKSLERRGFCVAEGAYERSMNGVGAALVLQDGSDVHAFSCSGPAFQLSARHLQVDVGPRLVAMVQTAREDVLRLTRAF